MQQFSRGEVVGVLGTGLSGDIVIVTIQDCKHLGEADYRGKPGGQSGPPPLAHEAECQT